MMGRESDLKAYAETLALQLGPGEREFLDGRFLNVEALQFSYGAWVSREGKEWTEEMEAYHSVLSDLQQIAIDRENYYSPIDPTAGERRISAYTRMTLNGE